MVALVEDLVILLRDGSVRPLIGFCYRLRHYCMKFLISGFVYMYNTLCCGKKKKKKSLRI